MIQHCVTQQLEVMRCDLYTAVTTQGQYGKGQHWGDWVNYNPALRWHEYRTRGKLLRRRESRVYGVRLVFGRESTNASRSVHSAGKQKKWKCDNFYANTTNLNAWLTC